MRKNRAGKKIEKLYGDILVIVLFCVLSVLLRLRPTVR